MNGQSAGKNFAYILGVYIGDGCITKPKSHPEYPYVFRLEVMDEDFAIAAKDALVSLGCKTNFRKSVQERYKQGYSFIVETRDKELTQALQFDTRYKTIIPQYVYKWDKGMKLAFIAGLMDSEGYVSKRTKPLRSGLANYAMGIKMDYEILKQFKPIMQSVGIITGKFSVTKPKWITNVQTATLCIRIKSWIDSGAYLHISRKTNRIEEYKRNINLNDYTPSVRPTVAKDIV